MRRRECSQWIKEGKGAIKWTRLSCRSFNANAVRLQPHALAYNLGNFLMNVRPASIRGKTTGDLRPFLRRTGFVGAGQAGAGLHDMKKTTARPAEHSVRSNDADNLISDCAQQYTEKSKSRCH